MVERHLAALARRAGAGRDGAAVRPQPRRGRRRGATTPLVRRSWRGYVAIGFGGNPALRAGLGEVGSPMGTLVKFEPSGHWRVLADVGGFKQARNPGGGPLDSNPHGLLAEPGRRFVTDAGGNDLLEVAANGDVSLVVTTFASFVAAAPFLSADPVPTAVERAQTERSTSASSLASRSLPVRRGSAGSSPARRRSSMRAASRRSRTSPSVKTAVSTSSSTPPRRCSSAVRAG